MLNTEIFAGLLRCIRNICTERFIEHLTIVDIADGSQNWFRNFFGLAGFCHCHCQRSTSSILQLEPRICVTLRKLPPEDFQTVHKTIRVWLVKSKCTRALLNSVTFGKAAEVERSYFHNLLTEIENGNDARGTQAHTKCKVRAQRQSQRPERESKRTSKVLRRKVSKIGNEVFSSRKHRSSQRGIVKMSGSAARARRVLNRSQKAQR